MRVRVLCITYWERGGGSVLVLRITISKIGKCLRNSFTNFFLFEGFVVCRLRGPYKVEHLVAEGLNMESIGSGTFGEGDIEALGIGREGKQEED